MKPRTFTLGFYFSLVIFVIMTASFFVISPFLLMALERGLLRSFNFLLIVLFIYIASALVGVVISAIVGNRILCPVLKFSSAAKKVAEGDFSVRVHEESRIEELSGMARDFNMMAQELGATKTMREDFIANISHEFKTPLSAVEGYAVLLRDAALTDAERRDYAEKILAQSRRMSALAGNILKISQLENREIVSDRKKYRLDEQLRQAILMLEDKWSTKALELEVELADTIIYANEELLMQVWLNILTNAFKFTPDGGRVTVTLTSDGESAKAVFADTGIGMSPETARHIFDKFYQGETSRSGEGNGLGLTLAERIVILCQGSISVETKEGEGSAFCVTLPL